MYVPHLIRGSNVRFKCVNVKNVPHYSERFDDGEDIHELIDISKAKVVRHGRKIRITLDVAEDLLREIDSIRDTIGVDRGALIKVWLYERVKRERALSAKD